MASYGKPAGFFSADYEFLRVIYHNITDVFEPHGCFFYFNTEFISDSVNQMSGHAGTGYDTFPITGFC